MMKILSVFLLFPVFVSAIEFVQDVPVTDVDQTFGVEFNMRGELHICSVGTHQVFKQVDGKLELVAGVGKPGHLGDNGPATEAHLNEPYEIRFDNAGNVFIVEMKNHLIRTIERWESIGVTGINFLLNAMEMVSQEAVLDSMRLFATEVMPRFQSDEEKSQPVSAPTTVDRALVEGRP